MRLIAGLFLWLAAACAQPFFFIQATDPQFGMYADNRDFAQETPNFEFLIATANRLHPAFVIVTGDLVNRAGDPAQTAEYLRIAGRLDPAIPIYHVPGNHDTGNAPTPESLAEYRAKFGPDYYAFRAGPMAGIVLNSTLIFDSRNVRGEAEKQEAWLRGELDKAKREGARHIVVFQHHPWFVHSPDEPDAYENLPKASRGKYLRLLEEYGVRFVFAGHYHNNAAGRGGAIQVVTTGPIGKPLRGGVSGFRIGVIQNGEIQHQYYQMGDVPNRLEH
jgi:3',5'-cyclic AMP phosphodiesterase CpdA